MFYLVCTISNLKVQFFRLFFFGKVTYYHEKNKNLHFNLIYSHKSKRLNVPSFRKDEIGYFHCVLFRIFIIQIRKTTLIFYVRHGRLRRRIFQLKSKVDMISFKIDKCIENLSRNQVIQLQFRLEEKDINTQVKPYNGTKRMSLPWVIWDKWSGREILKNSFHIHD